MMQHFLSTLRKQRKEICVVLTIIVVFSITAVLLVPSVGFIFYERKASIDDIQITNVNTTIDDLKLSLDDDDGLNATIISSKIADPMTYDATYTFSSELIGRHQISGWDTETGFSNPDVIEIDDGHSKVIDIENSSISTPVNREISTIEFWFKTTSTKQEGTFFSIFSGSSKIFSILSDFSQMTNTSKIKVNYDSSFGIICERYLDVWSRMSIETVVSKGIITISVDDIQYTPISMTLQENITKLSFENSSVHVDAIGFSWDNDYKIGNNRFPMKMYSISMSISFSISTFFFENVEKKSLKISGSSDNGENISSFLFMTIDGIVYKIRDVADNIIDNGNMSIIEFSQHKGLIGDGEIVIIIMIHDDSRVSLTIDSIQILFWVMI